MPEDESKAHAEQQRAYFDQRTFVFTQPIPPAVQERTRKIVEAARLDSQARVLDVATGIGVLVPHILSQGVRPENIMGCDLSPKMLDEARRRYPDVPFWQGDFLDFPHEFGPFDAIFFNACFGNFYDQGRVLQKAAALLSSDGRLLISHPMGARFVAQLRAAEPEIVPHCLPGRQALLEWATGLGLILDAFVEEADLYIAVLRRGQVAQS
ncbi:MAG TPA: class I SAM-dependent methyltransferase [Candidatus Obscuribacterales bacterium]